MIFYGSKSTMLNENMITKFSCPSCDSDNSLRMNIWGTYYHLYWIPTITLGRKKATIQCGHCQRSLEEQNFNEPQKQLSNKYKSESSIPLWYYTGAVIIGLFISFIFLS